MATSLRWLPLLVLGLLVVVAGGFGWIGRESFFVSRNGGGIGRRRLRENQPPPGSETSSRPVMEAVKAAVDDPEVVASMVQM